MLLLFFALLSFVSADLFYGLNYGINTNACPSLDQIKSDFLKIKPFTNRVRIFSLAPCQLGSLALEAANSLGMRLYLGMWIDRPDTFAAEMAAMTAILHSGQSLAGVDGLIVGSEVLYRNETDPASLAAYLAKVRALVHPIPITNADVYYEFPPIVVDQLDFLMMNAFPYWEGVTADQAARTLLDHYHSVLTKAAGKPVRISETGWPSAGANFGLSIASPENQKLYLQQALCITRQNNIDMLWFSAFDEPYKSGVEQHWGIMDLNRSLKPSLSNIASMAC